MSGSFLHTLAAALVRRGTAVTVLAPSDEGAGGRETRDGVAIERVRYAHASRETLAYRGTMTSAIRRPAGLVALRGLHRALRRAAGAELRAGARLVHAHWWIPAGLAVPPDAPFVLTCHGTDAALLRRSWPARVLARPVFRRARVVTAVSSELARTIERATGRAVDPSHVQPMPVETGTFRAGPGGGGIVVIGRLTRQKRVGLAIAAVARLRELGHDARLTIIGDGPTRPELEEEVRTRELGEVVAFAGAVPPASIPERLATADLMLFPAEREGFGLAAAEAFMCGVPVVACRDGGGLLDVVPADGAGRLASPTPEALARVALELLQDPSARQLAGEAGAEWRRRLDPDTAAAACERWYREALGE